MVKLNYKIKAFSILESMVSMVVVVIVFSLSAMVIANVTKTGMTRKKQDAYMLLKEMRNETIKNNRFIDEFVELNGLTLQKTILDYKGNEETRILLIEVLKGEEKIFESKELVIVKEE